MITNERRAAIKLAAAALRDFLTDHGAIVRRVKRTDHDGHKVIEAVTVDGRLAVIMVPNV